MNLGLPPVANTLEEAGEAGVDSGVLVEQEARPIAARLELAALPGSAFSFGQRFPEPFRPGRAELDAHQTLHLNHPSQAIAYLDRSVQAGIDVQPLFGSPGRSRLALEGELGVRAGPTCAGSPSSSVSFMPPSARRRGRSASVRHEHRRHAHPRPALPRGATARQAGRSTPPCSPRRLLPRA